MPHKMKALTLVKYFHLSAIETHIHFKKLDGISILRFFNRIHKVPTIVVEPLLIYAPRFVLLFHLFYFLTNNRYKSIPQSSAKENTPVSKRTEKPLFSKKKNEASVSSFKAEK